MSERKAYDIGLNPLAHSHLIVLQLVLAQLVNHLNLSEKVKSELASIGTPKSQLYESGRKSNS